jgi:hypothetical protein
MLENTEGTIKNGQSRETGNTGYTRHIKDEVTSVNSTWRLCEFVLLIWYQVGYPEFVSWIYFVFLTPHA